MIEDNIHSQEPGGNRPTASLDSFFEELIPDFFDEVKEAINTMHAALNSPDFETINRMGHGFKGAARNYQLNDLSEIFLSVEKSAEQNSSKGIQQALRKAEWYISHVDITYK